MPCEVYFVKTQPISTDIRYFVQVIFVYKPILPWNHIELNYGTLHTS
jgi:hypothetical protein